MTTFLSIVCPLLLIAWGCTWAVLRVHKTLAEFWRDAYLHRCQQEHGNRRREHPMRECIHRAGLRNGNRMNLSLGLAVAVLLPHLGSAADASAKVGRESSRAETLQVRLAPSNTLSRTIAFNQTTVFQLRTQLQAHFGVDIVEILTELQTNWLAFSVQVPRGDGTAVDERRELGLVVSNRFACFVVDGKTNKVLISSAPIQTPTLLTRDASRGIFFVTNWPGRMFTITNTP